MDYSHNGTGKHRPRASHARRTSSESHRSDWDPAEGFEQHPLPYRERRRGSHTQMPDEGRKANYYPPSPIRPRRASDVPARSHDPAPHTPNSVGGRTGRPAPGPRTRAPAGSTRTPSAPRRVVEASEESSEEDSEDSDEDEDDDEEDIVHRSRAVSRAASQLRPTIASRAASPTSEASKDTTLSIEIASQPRTSGARSRAVSRAASRAASRARSSRRPMLRESDADIETDSEAESGSDASSDAIAPPRGPSQAVARRKQIQGAPAQVSELVPAKRSTPIKKQPKAAYDVDDSDVSEESTFSVDREPRPDLDRLRSRQQPPEIQVARYASPTREHRRHHSDPKRPSRKQHLSPVPRSGPRRTPASPKVYYSSQSSINNFHRSHTAPSSYVTSRSAPTRRSTSTRRSSTWVESHQTLQAEPGKKPGRSNCHSCDRREYLSDRLDCQHRLCGTCLQDAFRDARTGRSIPVCHCGQPINAEIVESVLPFKFRSGWNKHFAKQMAQQRIFCPIHFCGVWIPPQSPGQRQRSGQCPQCQIHVCLLCHQNMKLHKKSRDCPPIDAAAARQQEEAQHNPMRFCRKCKGPVRLSEDHPSTECHECQLQTCAACDSKWRTCRCPWFVDERDAGPQGRQLPRAPMLEPQVPEVPEIAPPPRSRRLSSSGRTNRSRASHQHHEDRRRRQHDRAEKAFTQQIVYDEPEEEFDDVVAIGNASGHFMNDDYRRGHETLVTPPSPPQQHPGVPFDRAEPGANYISGVNRARGVNGRNGSMERLAERFSDQRTGGSPAHRHFPPMPAQPSPSVPRTMATPPMMMPMAGPPIPNLRRNHTFDDDLSSPRMPLTERVPLRRRTNDFVPEDPMEYPSPSSRSSRSQQSRRRDTDTAYSTSPQHDPTNPASALAGLTGEGRGKDRVMEWRTYVEPKRHGSVTAQG